MGSCNQGLRTEGRRRTRSRGSRTSCPSSSRSGTWAPWAASSNEGSPLSSRGIGLGLRRLPTGRTNLVDAGIAEPIREDAVSPDVLEIGGISGAVEAEIGMRVRKSGRTSGLTTGRVTAIDGVVRVDYGGPHAVFRRQVVSDLVSKGGDSGSVVVDGSRRAVGLLFAGSAVSSLLNPIDAVLKELDLEL